MKEMQQVLEEEPSSSVRCRVNRASATKRVDSGSFLEIPTKAYTN